MLLCTFLMSRLSVDLTANKVSPPCVSYSSKLLFFVWISFIYAAFQWLNWKKTGVNLFPVLFIENPAVVINTCCVCTDRGSKLVK